MSKPSATWSEILTSTGDLMIGDPDALNADDLRAAAESAADFVETQGNIETPEIAQAAESQLVILYQATADELNNVADAIDGGDEAAMSWCSIHGGHERPRRGKRPRHRVRDPHDRPAESSTHSNHPNTKCGNGRRVSPPAVSFPRFCRLRRSVLHSPRHAAIAAASLDFAHVIPKACAHQYMVPGNVPEPDPCFRI